MSYKAGFVGIVGQPNVGKSTLMNVLVKEKVSIVTNKPQTTRRRTHGIISEKNGQVIFVDAPGLVGATSKLNEFLKKEMEEVIADSDVLMALAALDQKTAESVDDILEIVQKSKKPWVGVITKTDLTEFDRRLIAIEEKMKNAGAKAVLRFAKNLNPKQITEFVQTVVELCPDAKGPLYDEELLTSDSTKDLVSEMIREKCFDELYQDVPYNLAVQIRKFDETDPKITRIYADILVAKSSQKPIVVGKGGELIRKIGTEARKDIERLLGHQVFLKLEVVVKEDWFDQKKLMKELGYVVDESK